MPRGLKTIVVFLVACILLICLWCLTFRLYPLELSSGPRHDGGCEMSIQAGIPKRIWTFWNSEKVPPVVAACIGTWKRCCPGYEICVLTPETLSDVLPNAREILELPFANTPQRLADFIRLHVLYRHGGYWLDASIVLFGSLDVFGQQQKRLQSEYVGYYIDEFTRDEHAPIIENWFFGCVKESTFVGMWRDEFMRINQYSSALAYVDHIRMHGVRFEGIPHFLSYYLSMHVAAQVVIQRHAYPLDRCFLQTAESGPLQYLARNRWGSENAIAWLVASVEQEGSDMPLFVKLRKGERYIVARDPYVLDVLTRSSSSSKR
jgi:hypothetical protein